MPVAMLVFDRYELPNPLHDPLHELAANAFHGEGHVPWEVGAETESNGLGWMTPEVEQQFDEYFKSVGVPIGQHLLMYNWW